MLPKEQSFSSVHLILLALVNISGCGSFLPVLPELSTAQRTKQEPTPAAPKHLTLPLWQPEFCEFKLQFKMWTLIKFILRKLIRIRTVEKSGSSCPHPYSSTGELRLAQGADFFS